MVVRIHPQAAGVIRDKAGPGAQAFTRHPTAGRPPRFRQQPAGVYPGRLRPVRGALDIITPRAEAGLDTAAPGPSAGPERPEKKARPSGGSIGFYNNISDPNRDSIQIFTRHHNRYEPSQYEARLPWLVSFLDSIYVRASTGYAVGLFAPAPSVHGIKAPDLGAYNPEVPIDPKSRNMPQRSSAAYADNLARQTDANGGGGAPQQTGTPYGQTLPKNRDMRKQFTSRKEVDEYISGFIREGRLSEEVISQYKWDMIRKYDLPANYDRR